MSSVYIGHGQTEMSKSTANASGLLKAKVLPPELPSRYVSRPALLQRLEHTMERRVTVLQAPAGFGKTTVMADVVRARKRDGMVVAWISLDVEDTPNLFGSYLALALERAGLDLGLSGSPVTRSAWPALQQLGTLAGAIEQHAAPCLLVLDEVDRLPRRTVRLVDLLLEHAPSNLHVVMAFRSNPGVNVGTHLLSGGAIVLGTESFRVQRADIDRFLGRELSRKERAEIEERTAGWPFALMVYRSVGGADAEQAGREAAELTRNYIGLHVLRDLSDKEQACLFDLAVFDCIDGSLVDAVLGSNDARMLLTALPALDGLLLPGKGDDAAKRLHPLLREYCLDALSVANPARKRSLHTKIARELVRRGGQLTALWRHAGAAADNDLLGELIERSGPFQLWLHEGTARLASAGRFLTRETTARYPRLDLLRCIVLCLSLKWDEAETLFQTISQRTDGFTRDRDGGNAEALAVDAMFTRAVLRGGADRLLPHELESRFPAGDPLPGDEEGRALACARHTMLCIACYEHASFEESARHGLRAQAHFRKDGCFFRIVLDACLGMAAMAQGRVQEAVEKYRDIRRATRKFFPADPWISAISNALTIELDLERNRVRAVRRKTLERLTQSQGVWADGYSTSVAVSAELLFEQCGEAEAIQLLTRSVDRVRATRNRSLLNTISALLADYLTQAGQSEQAGAVWRDHALPCDAAELLDLERQSWRTMEALSCARIRLLEAQGEFDAASELAHNLGRVAGDRGLVRTLLRGIALSMSVAHRAGQPDRALERLVGFIRATRGVDYTRPLVRQREVSRLVLQRLLDTDCDDDLRPAAESLLAQVVGPETGSPCFSPREREILTHVARGLRNKEIAELLEITEEGVRYHLKNIYRKTGINKRAEAVSRAQAIGSLS
ncbi:MAG: hypothetical protein F4Y45_05110 [Acidobacteria bacterium]|nr:hypothetical protein [Acidobacteriota bacterium]MYJ04157.1 hypothetical protein [Acidobacteriota bacterium]